MRQSWIVIKRYDKLFHSRMIFRQSQNLFPNCSSSNSHYYVLFNSQRPFRQINSLAIHICCGKDLKQDVHCSVLYMLYTLFTIVILLGILFGQFAKKHCQFVRTKALDNWTIWKKRLQLIINNFKNNFI